MLNNMAVLSISYIYTYLLKQLESYYQMNNQHISSLLRLLTTILLSLFSYAHIHFLIHFLIYFLIYLIQNHTFLCFVW